MRLTKDSMSQDVTIQRVLSGYYDANQQRVEPGSVLIASVVNASIQPVGGKKTVTSTKQGFGQIGSSGTHEGYLGTDDITFEAGYSTIEAGDILYDENLQPYEILFPGLYKGSHYQASLEKMRV